MLVHSSFAGPIYGGRRDRHQAALREVAKGLVRQPVSPRRAYCGLRAGGGRALVVGKLDAEAAGGRALRIDDEPRHRFGLGGPDPTAPQGP
jgi:hypothetical protein